jgi:uncharacterized protein YfaS (alpha-2-macroglobulin family)
MRYQALVQGLRRRSRLIIGMIVVALLVGLGIALGPMLLAGPRIVAVTPADADRAVNPSGVLRIEFDQWVNRDSVLAAVSLDPPVEYAAEWERRAVNLRPHADLGHGQQYRLTIKPGVKNVLGRASADSRTVAFATMPYVAAVGFGPESGAAAQPLRTPITVEFDLPVVPADSVAKAADDPSLADALPQPLALAPATAGIGRWLSPTLYGFYPEGDLLPATVYTATVGSDISGDGRVQMEQPASWSFSTAAPLLLGARPYDGASEVAAQAPIEVRLDTGVDPASAGAHFALQRSDTGDSVSGAIQPAEQGFQFIPAAALERGVSYEARLDPGIQSVAGARLNARPLSWTFTVIGDLAVDQVAPPADTSEVLTTTERISVHFNHPVVALTSIDQQAGLPQPLEIAPPLAGVGRWIDTSTYSYSPTAGFAPSTSYRVAIKSGLADQTGGVLRGDFSWSFTTIQPLVARSTPEPNEDQASPVDPIILTFNQPMDPASLEASLALRVNEANERVPGTLKVAGNRATFTPAEPLVRGARYELSVAAGARAAGGSGAMAQTYESVFRVAPAPALVGSSPADGEEAAYGSVRLSFSTPLDWATLDRNLSIEPAPTHIYTYTYENEFTLDFDAVPETDYTLTVGGASRDPYGVELGDDQVIHFRTRPLGPSLSIVGPYQMAAYNAYAPIQLSVRQTNITTLKYALYPLDQLQVNNLINNYEAWNSFAPAVSIDQGEVTLDGPRNQERIEQLELGELAPGLYYLVVDGPPTISDRQIMVVSPAALTVKRTPDELFIWAVDLASGQPLADLALSAQAGLDGAVQPLGRTDAEGILRAPIAGASPYDPLLVWSEAGERFSLTSSNWGEGINAWDFGLPTEYSPATLAGNFTTDRPIYRPDQEVHLRGALRSINQERYVLPATGRPARLTISDPQGTVVLSGSFPLSDFGTFSATVKLDRSAAIGSYTMVASLPENPDTNVYGSFMVAEYRKPVFDLTVTPAAPDLVPGEPLELAVSAQYFSGGAVANAPVRWRLLAQPLFFSSELAPNFSFQDLDDPYAFYHWDESANNTPNGTLIAEGAATTDAQGRLTVRPALNLDGATGSQRLTLDVEVSDIDGQVIAGQGAASLHAGDFYIGLRPEGYVGQIGEPRQVALIALTPQDQQRPAQDLEVAIYQHEWFSVQEQGADGRLYWTSRFTDTLVEKQPATTDAQGRASITFTPQAGGAYRIQASGRDSAGREIKSSAFTWVYGGDVFWGVNATNRIDLIADKSSYRPGETAKILVPAPYKGMTALLTIERGHVLEHRVLTLADSSELLPIELTAEHAPNVYVSVVLIKPGGADMPVPDIRMGLINLPISIEQQELTVTVSADKQQAGPRDQVTYTIEATDYQGRGVQSEIALALVDKAVLALADNPNPSLRGSFYEKRPLGVFTSSSLTALVDRVALRGQAGSKGGGGGAAADLLVRQNIPDTAYWNPAVITGPDGKAQVTITLPDNLTTWRMSAQSLTADTRVGQGDGDLVASLPLLIRPTLPRFLTVGDQVTLQAVVQNTTADPIEATVNLNPGLLTLDGPAEQRVSVAANDRAVVQWTAKAEKDGQATLLFSVSGGGLQDAVEQRLPVQRFVTPEVVASAGQVGASPVIETLAIPAGRQPAGPTQGEVTLELVPSLGAGIQSGLDYLRAYAYDCTEQTVSRFLPNAVSYRLYTQLGLDNPGLKAGLEANLGSDLQRLYSLQQLDGGWGWWQGDNSNPYLSAYAMQGLVEVRRAGYSVDEQVYAAGLKYLKDVLAGDALATRSAEPWRINARAYVLFVLAEAGDPDQGRTLALYEERANLQIYGRAYLLMTLQTVQPGSPQIKTLRADLMGTALLSPTSAHWEERSQDYWTMSSDTRTTALALQALVRTDPANYLVPNAVRYLMGLRDHGHWQTTQESAVTLMALSEYIAQSGELEADYRYRVSLDDALLGDGTVNRANHHDPITLVADLAQVNLEKGSQLRIERQDQNNGRGRLYYTLRMRYYQDAAAAKPLDQGLVLGREYSAVDSTTFSATGQLVSQAALGDVVQVRLTIDVPENMQYVIVEDMLPAGLEALDTSLKTVSAAADAPAFGPAGRPYWWYFTQTSIRDNRVALFATDLPAGTYHYTYLARASSLGAFQTLPATAYQMYAPEVFGRSAGALFTVK